MPIPLIVMGVATVASAKIKSNAAKKAAEAQQKGTDQALQVQQKANAPYMQLGQEGVNRLMAMGPAQPFTQQFQPRGPQIPGQPLGPAPSTGFQPFQPSGGPQGAPPTLGSIGMGQPPQGLPQGQPGAGMEQMATVQAPTGEVARIAVGPMLEKALAGGAKRLA